MIAFPTIRRRASLLDPTLTCLPSRTIHRRSNPSTTGYGCSSPRRFKPARFSAVDLRSREDAVARRRRNSRAIDEEVNQAVPEQYEDEIHPLKPSAGSEQSGADVLQQPVRAGNAHVALSNTSQSQDDEDRSHALPTVRIRCFGLRPLPEQQRASFHISEQGNGATHTRPHSEPLSILELLSDQEPHGLLSDHVLPAVQKVAPWRTGLVYLRCLYGILYIDMRLLFLFPSLSVNLPCALMDDVRREHAATIATALHHLCATDHFNDSEERKENVLIFRVKDSYRGEKKACT